MGVEKINSYNEILKLLIAYDNKLITQKEFEERKKELLDEEKRTRADSEDPQQMVPSYSKNDFLREQRSLIAKRILAVFMMMLFMGGVVGIAYIKWHSLFPGGSAVTDPDPLPIEQSLHEFSFPIEDLSGLDYEALVKLYGPLRKAEDESVQLDENTINIFNVYHWSKDEEKVDFYFYFYEERLVRVKIMTDQRWLFEGPLQTAKRFGIDLTSEAWPMEDSAENKVWQRVNSQIEELGFYKIEEEKSYRGVVFTFEQELFGPLTVKDSEIYWQGAKKIVKAALSRPDSAVFPTEKRNYKVVEFAGKIWISSQVEYRNAKDELTTSSFTVRFFPNEPEEANALIMDGEVLYDWS